MNARDQKANNIEARLFRIPDDTKVQLEGKVFPLAAQHGLFGHVKRYFTANNSYNCKHCETTNTTSICHGCAHETNILDAQDMQILNVSTDLKNYHLVSIEIRLEGGVSCINNAISGIKYYHKIDLKTYEVQIESLRSLYSTFVVQPTVTTIKHIDYQGIRSPQEKIDLVFQIQRETEAQDAFYASKRMHEALLIRDGGCKLHGKNCKFSNSTKLDTLAIGFLSEPNGPNSIRVVRRFHLTYCVQNGYLFCLPAAWCWNRDLFGVDPLNGNAVFAPEFPFEQLDIDVHKIYKLGFDEDEKEDEHEMIKTEPFQQIVRLRHQIYVSNRLQKYQQNMNLNASQINESNDRKEVDFRLRNYCVCSKPVCNCSWCQKQQK